MTNPMFPNWQTATIVLNDLIDNDFGARVEMDGSELFISFLPPVATDRIPPEYRLSFKVLGETFIRELDMTLGINDAITDMVIGEMVDSNLLVCVTEQINQLLFTYEARYGKKAEDAYKQLLGIDTNTIKGEFLT